MCAARRAHYLELVKLGMNFTQTAKAVGVSKRTGKVWPAVRSVVVVVLSGIRMRVTPPNSPNACICPSCYDLCFMSQNPSIQNLSENGSAITKT